MMKAVAAAVTTHLNCVAICYKVFHSPFRPIQQHGTRTASMIGHACACLCMFIWCTHSLRTELNRFNSTDRTSRQIRSSQVLVLMMFVHIISDVCVLRRNYNQVHHKVHIILIIIMNIYVLMYIYSMHEYMMYEQGLHCVTSSNW